MDNGLEIVSTTIAQALNSLRTTAYKANRLCKEKGAAATNHG